MAYGPGGSPHNIIGWFGVRVVMRPFKREMFSTDIYTRKIKDGETTTYLSGEKELRPREGGRPRIGPHMVPQRQLDEFASKEMQEVIYHVVCLVVSVERDETRLLLRQQRRQILS